MCIFWHQIIPNSLKWSKQWPFPPLKWQLQQVFPTVFGGFHRPFFAYEVLMPWRMRQQCQPVLGPLLGIKHSPFSGLVFLFAISWGPKPRNTGGNVVSLLFHIIFPSGTFINNVQCFRQDPKIYIIQDPIEKWWNMAHALDIFGRNLRPSRSMYDLQFVSSSSSRFEKPVKIVHYLWLHLLVNWKILQGPKWYIIYDGFIYTSRIYSQFTFNMFICFADTYQSMKRLVNWCFG